MAEDARSLLVETRLKHLLKEQHNIVVLKDSATVEQALKVLATHRVLSAPVVVAPAAEQAAGGEERESGGPAAAPAGEEECVYTAADGAEIAGFVDIRDILLSFLKGIDPVSALASQSLLQRMRVLEEAGAQFAVTPLKQLAVMGTDGDFLHSSQARSSLLEFVVNGLLQPRAQRGGSARPLSAPVVHRIALFDNNGHVTAVVSQTDVVRFLLSHEDRLSSLLSMPVTALGLGASPPVSVLPETAAITAMAVMAERQLSSVAVVDATGRLLGNFSMSDMRTIMREHFGALALPVAEFIACEHRTEFTGFNRVHEEGLAGTPGHRFVCDTVNRRRPRTPGCEVGQQLVVVTGDATLGEVMSLLVRNRIHRVYVVDEEERPTGIITTTDLLRAVVGMQGREQGQGREAK